MKPKKVYIHLLIKKYSHPFRGVEVKDDWVEGSWAIEYEDIGVSKRNRSELYLGCVQRVVHSYELGTLGLIERARIC